MSNVKKTAIVEKLVGGSLIMDLPMIDDPVRRRKFHMLDRTKQTRIPMQYALSILENMECEHLYRGGYIAFKNVEEVKEAAEAYDIFIEEEYIRELDGEMVILSPESSRREYFLKKITDKRTTEKVLKEFLGTLTDLQKTQVVELCIEHMDDINRGIITTIEEALDITIVSV